VPVLPRRGSLPALACFGRWAQSSSRFLSQRQVLPVLHNGRKDEWSQRALGKVFWARQNCGSDIAEDRPQRRAAIEALRRTLSTVLARLSSEIAGLRLICA
jgi:hypothetical protein